MEDIVHLQTHDLVLMTKNLRSLQDLDFRGPVGKLLNDAPNLPRGQFIGRDLEISAIRQVLQPQDDTDRRLVLGGMAGVGKTQLAIAYARKYPGDHDSILYVNGTTEVTLIQSFRLLVQSMFAERDCYHLSDERVCAVLNTWLADRRNRQWLLIVDNYNNPERYQLGRYLPNYEHGSIIVVSQVPRRFRLPPIDRINEKVVIQPFTNADEGLQILEQRSGRCALKDGDARLLVARMGGLPLALATAGHYLSQNPLDFKEYLQAYESRWTIKPEWPIRLPDYESTLYTAWQPIMKRLKASDQNTADTVKLLAYFGRRCISYGLLRAGRNNNLPWTVWRVRKAGFSALMDQLTTYSVVEHDTREDEYRIHPCVHDWLLADLNKTFDAQRYEYVMNCFIEYSSRSATDHPKELEYHAQRLSQIHQRHSVATDKCWRRGEDCVISFLGHQSNLDLGLYER